MQEPKTAAEWNELARKQLELEPEKAFETAHSALRVAREEGDKLQEAEAQRHVGSAYWALSEYHLALENYFCALRLSEELGDQLGIAGVHNNLALVYGKLDRLDEAQRHLEESVSILKSLGNDFRYAAACNNLGKLHELRGNLKEALTSHLETLRITQQMDYEPGVLRAKLNVGSVRYQMNQYDFAEDYYREAYELAVKLGYTHEQVQLLANRVKNFAYAHRWSDAEPLLQQAEELIGTMQARSLRMSVLEAKVALFAERARWHREEERLEEAWNDLETAYKGVVKRDEVRSSIFNEEMTDKIARLHTLFQLEREQHVARIAQQQTEIYRLENVELVKRQQELERALGDIKQLQGLIPICSSCKKIRDDSGFWQQVEEYISAHSQAQFTHSLCPQCLQELYPDIYEKLMKDGKLNIAKQEV